MHIPGRHILLFAHSNAEQAAENVEHSGRDALQRKIGPERFFVEIVEGSALLFGEISDVPRRQLAGGESLQIAILLAEPRLGLLAQIVDKGLRAPASVGHAVVQDEVGEIAEPEQFCLFPA